MYKFPPEVRQALGSLVLYRWLSKTAGYSPDSPYPSHARFGDGRVATLYLAETLSGALAEFIRVHPEFGSIPLDDWDLQTFSVSVDVIGEVCDVRTPALSALAAFPHDRLISSDYDPAVRFAECRVLAVEVGEVPLFGIAYPSAAAAWETWNLVLFGEPDTTTWVSQGVTRVDLPTTFDSSAARPLDLN